MVIYCPNQDCMNKEENMFYTFTNANQIINEEWNPRGIMKNTKQERIVEFFQNKRGYNDPIASKAQTISNCLIMDMVLNIQMIHMRTDYRAIIELIHDLAEAERNKASKVMNKTHLGFLIHKNQDYPESDGSWIY